MQEICKDMRKSFTLFALLLTIKSISAQSTFYGIWEGKMNAGVEIRMVFNISEDSSKNVQATIASPDQGLQGVKASSIQLKGDSVHLEISQYKASYSGKLTGDTGITGNFVQNGMSFPLNLKKVLKITTRKRPQTPEGPFPYTSEDLTYTNKSGSQTFGATITIPKGKGPFPAILLLTGSGPQNRDEEIMDHKPFAVIADHLTRNGFLVLRVDDRGTGKTTGDASAATTRDFADDAIVSLNFLLNRKEVNKRKIGMIGHSEGGMIAQIIAAERSDINFVIMLAAPGEQITKLMSDQNEAILAKMGLQKDFVTAYLKLYNGITNVLVSNTDSLNDKVKAITDEWIATTPSNIVALTTGIRDEKTKNNVINQFMGQLNNPWFKYFLKYDPAPVIKKISASVLAVNGNKDIQVISKTNLAGIEGALKESRSKKFEVKELEGLNHLFQECKQCTLAEYAQLDQTISPVVLDIITKWLKEVVGN